MKTQNIILSLILMLLLVFSACREVTVTTKVNRDGTFTRIITVSGDSSDVIRADLPFPVNDTWEKTFNRDESDSTKYMVTYSKKFRNSNGLNAEIQSDTSFYRNIGREVTIKRKFGFFYNYLIFNEVYNSINPFTFLDYKDFLTEEDLLWYSGLKMPGTPADSIIKNQAENKVSNFFVESASAEIEHILAESIKKLENPALDPSDIPFYHDSLVKFVENWDYTRGDDIIDHYRNWTGNDAYLMLLDLTPPLFDDFQNKMDLLERIAFIEGYTEKVEMPGLITGTNSVMLKGNQVSWELDASAFALRDFEIYAESRVINYWAFILLGVVVLGLLVLLIIKAVK